MFSPSKDAWPALTSYSIKDMKAINQYEEPDMESWGPCQYNILLEDLMKYYRLNICI